MHGSMEGATRTAPGPGPLTSATVSKFPSVSTVILSYLRDRYLSDSLRSALTQHPLGPYEVILVTSIPQFRPVEDVRRLTESRGSVYKQIYVPPGPVGVSIAAGLAEAQGELIALLDDDDVWEPGRIREVQRQFARHPGTDYFHNSQTLVDAQDRPLPWWNLHRLVRHTSTLRPPGRSRSLSVDDLAIGRTLRVFGLAFNNSSMVVRAAILREVAPRLVQVAGGEDNFLLYAALKSGSRFYVTSDRLTRVRVHDNSTTSRVAVTDGDPNAGLGNYASFIRRHLDERRIGSDLLAGTANPTLRELIAKDTASLNLIGGPAVGGQNRSQIFGDFRVILTPGRVPPSLVDFAALLLGVVEFVSPTGGRIALRLWRATR